mgnify:CR=1 FL=1
MLRSHLGSCRGYIVTVWGVGYKLTPIPHSNVRGRDLRNQSTGQRTAHPAGWRWGVQGQLMLLLCGITVLTLGLVWGLISYGLQPMYNRNIQSGWNANPA